MHTVIRNYVGAPTLADELKKKSKEVEREISGVPGFIAYYLLKTPEGIAAVTVCEQKVGCDESTKRAANWLRQHLPSLKIAAPQIIHGEVTMKFANYRTRV